MDKYEPIVIMLVESERAEIREIAKALYETKVVNRLLVYDDSEKARVYYLDDQNPKPDLVIIDLKTATNNGRELLKIIKSGAFGDIPVICLGDGEKDVEISRIYKANFFVQKPMKPSAVLTIVQAVDNLDLAIVKKVPERSENNVRLPG